MMMEATAEEPEVKQQSKKKGFFSILRRNKKDRKSTQQEEAAPAETESEPDAEPVEESTDQKQSTKDDEDVDEEEEDYGRAVTRDGTPVITAGRVGKPSTVRESKKSIKNGKTVFRKSVVLEKAPDARESAFSGPPRYDWIDIETAAAVKVQSIYRRNKVMSDMEEQGMETAAMRNRSRRRRARRGNKGVANEDTPGLFACCGLGLMFGDASEEDEKAQKAFEKAQYEEKKRARAEREEKLRAYHPRAKPDFKLTEGIEIVE